MLELSLSLTNPLSDISILSNWNSMSVAIGFNFWRISSSLVMLYLLLLMLFLISSLVLLLFMVAETCKMTFILLCFYFFKSQILDFEIL